MRKLIIVLAFTSGLSGLSFGQGFIPMSLAQPSVLKAAAGTDTLVCSNHAVILGGNPSATGGNSSYVYLWSPPEGLNDPTSSNPTAILSASKSYMLSVTDGRGCQAVSYININVDACLGTNSLDLNPVITVYPNPSNGVFTIGGLSSMNSQLKKIEILNHLGQNLFAEEFKPGDFVSDLLLDTNIQEPGIYFLKITLLNQVISKRLIVR